MAYAAVIDWYGPYASVREAKAASRKLEFGEALYLAIGTVERQRIPHLQYVGITHDFCARLNPKHTIRKFVSEEGLSLYIGVVSSQGVAGRRPSHHSQKHSSLVDLAEDAIAFLLELPLNIDKRTRPPKDSIIIVNRWWHDDDRRKRRRPHWDWPDYLEYDDHSDTAMVAWHGGSRHHYNEAALQDICKRARRDIKKLKARKQKALTGD